MKVWEILKEENEGKKYLSTDEISFEVNNGFLVSELGLKVELSENILKTEFEEIDIFKSGWERVPELQEYYYVGCDDVDSFFEVEDSTDEEMYNSANYFSTKEKANEVYYEQLLYRMMKRFRDENDHTTNWDDYVYYIEYDSEAKCFEVDFARCYRKLHSIDFATRRLAERCLEEVVMPFMDKHKEYIKF